MIIEIPGISSTDDISFFQKKYEKDIKSVITSFDNNLTPKVIFTFKNADLKVTFLRNNEKPREIKPEPEYLKNMRNIFNKKKKAEDDIETELGINQHCEKNGNALIDAETSFTLKDEYPEHWIPNSCGIF